MSELEGRDDEQIIQIMSVDGLAICERSPLRKPNVGQRACMFMSRAYALSACRSLSRINIQRYAYISRGHCSIVVKFTLPHAPSVRMAIPGNTRTVQRMGDLRKEEKYCYRRLRQARALQEIRFACQRTRDIVAYVPRHRPRWISIF